MLERSSPKPTCANCQGGWRFVLPWVVGVVILTVVPLVFSLLLSLVRWDGMDYGDIAWVGLDHYREFTRVDARQPLAEADPWYWHLLGGQPADPSFYRSLYNSLVFSGFAVPLGLIVALALAVLLNTSLRGVGFFRTLFYLPHVLGGVATILVWSWIFNPQFGPINALIAGVYTALDPLVRLGGGQGTSAWPLPSWLMSPVWCKPAVVVMHVWTAGGAVFVFLAVLQRVDPATHEAARLDGAGRWDRFYLITLPQITPAVMFNLVTGLAAAMQAFNQPYLLYNRAQNDGLLFYVLQLYRCAFEPPYRLGYASAMAWVLFALVLVLALLALLSGRKWVHYES